MKLKHMREYIETLQAVEILEYHNSNWLIGSNKSRSESKQEVYRELLKEIKK